MKAAFFFAAFALALCGCSGPKVVPATKVEIQRVEVPVMVRRDAPPELLQCANTVTAPARPPQLRDTAGGLLIPTSEIDALTRFLHDEAEARRQALGCDAAWRAWAAAP